MSCDKRSAEEEFSSQPWRPREGFPEEKTAHAVGWEPWDLGSDGHGCESQVYVIHPSIHSFNRHVLSTVTCIFRGTRNIVVNKGGMEWSGKACLIR